MAFLKQMVAACIVFLVASSAFSQSGTVHAEEAVGTIKGNETGNIFKRIDAVKNIDKAKAVSLKKSLAEQLKIFYSHPLLNPPKGFEVKTGFSIAKGPFAKTVLFPYCGLSFGFYYLNKLGETGNVKVSMDGTLIGMETNAEDHFFRQVGNFWKECSDAKFPLFFEQPPIADSTADYIELNFRNYGYPAIAPTKPFRIVKRNDRPLFIPLTRKEFVQFLIAQKEYQIKDDGETVADLEKNLKQSMETLKNPPSYMNPEILKVRADGIVVTQKQIDSKKEEIGNKQEKIKEYESLINGMTPPEALSPTRLDYNKKIEDFDKLKRLVPLGRMEGVGLFKINPGYYDRSAGASDAQLIFVYYQLPREGAFEITEFNYLEKKTIDIFNQMDYHELKESME